MHQPRDGIVGVISPPQGVTPNFIDPPSTKQIILIINVVFSLISILVVIVRLYTIRFITRKVGVDDYVVALSWLLALGASITQCLYTRYGLGLHLWDVPFSKFNINFFLVGLTNGTFYGLSIMFTKVSILAFYLRFSPYQKLRKAVYTVLAIVVIYSLIASFEWVYACQPIEKYWDLTISRGSCIDRSKIYVFSGVMNTTTDAVILLLPVLMLRKVQLPRRQKIGLTLVMMTGGFVLIISIIKLKMTMDLIHQVDVTWEYSHVAVWGTIEMHIAIVCACLPAGKPFLRRHFPKVIGSTIHTSYGTRRQTMRSSHAQQLPSKEADEVPLSEFSRQVQDGESQTSASTSRVDYVESRDFETI